MGTQSPLSFRASGTEGRNDRAIFCSVLQTPLTIARDIRKTGTLHGNFLRFSGCYYLGDVIFSGKNVGKKIDLMDSR